MSALPFDQREQPPEVAYQCSICGRLDSEGTRGPGKIRGYWGYYVRVLGPWLCWPHSVQVWEAYLTARRERMELVQAYRIVGYPMTRDQLEAWKSEQSTHGEQLALVSPRKPRRRRRRRRRKAA